MQKYVFGDFPPKLVKSKCTKDYDFYTIRRITDLQSGNFVEATLKVPKGVSKARSDYLNSEKRKARYQSHKEEEKAKRRARYQANKEVEKAKRKIYYQTHKEEEKAKRKARYYKPLIEAELKEKTLLIDLCKETRLNDRIRGALIRGYGYSPLNIPFRGSCIHHLHEEHNNSFCVHIPLFLHKLIPHIPKTGYGMQTINAVALSYWLIDYQFFKDD